jgi:hypothetical protein
LAKAGDTYYSPGHSHCAILVVVVCYVIVSLCVKEPRFKCLVFFRLSGPERNLPEVKLLLEAQSQGLDITV